MSSHETINRGSYPKPQLIGILKGPAFLEHELIGENGEIIPLIDDESSNSYVVINDRNVPILEAIESGFIKEVSDLHRKLSQSGYDQFAKRANRQGKPVVIPVGMDTSDIVLDKSLKHHFLGSNIIGQVPPGSIISEGSYIFGGGVISGCEIGPDCHCGDDTIFINSKIGTSFEVGNGAQFDNCIIDSCMACPEIKEISKCTINYGLMSEAVERFGDDNIILPGYHIGAIEEMGVNNVILGERRLPVPEIGGPGNVCVKSQLSPIPMSASADDVYQLREKLKSNPNVKEAWDKFSQSHSLNNDQDAPTFNVDF